MNQAITPSEGTEVQKPITVAQNSVSTEGAEESGNAPGKGFREGEDAVREGGGGPMGRIGKQRRTPSGGGINPGIV